ncbi:esterase-like activity of phytase family protein [Metabacillus sp. GX 13764]|uniref:esterase-like activity of phytase family protein n=1 Tax=Metabacillus kandeliae TaxID=2900151 RepID=UPI001E35AF29|nr:esterase-like activity of phytase family protein [Metabacillus kandeliae]MCD7033621.1 esterase-like activity of phytase family protein [Metabacillus kandeliae]
MKNKMYIAFIAIAIILLAAAGCGKSSQQQEKKKDGSGSSAGGAELIEKYTLTDPPKLSKNILGAMGSSLVHIPGDPENIFYSSGDRGPNGKVTVNNEERRTFLLPDYTPTIYKIKVSNKKINILEEIKLKLPKGKDSVTGTAFITGLPNFKEYDKAPYDEKGEKVISYDPYGLDTEGIAYNSKDKTFWISDEYRPSLLQVKKDGTILQRLVPAGTEKEFKKASLIPVKGTLPAVLTKRMDNRGFEGVSITPDGRYLFTITQSALKNPDEDSRIGRLLKIDLNTAKVAAEYVYTGEDGKALDTDQKDIGVSDLIAMDEKTLLVDERDSEAGKKAKLKKIYKVSLKEATNVLGKEEYNGKTLEQLKPEGLKGAGITAASKKEVLDPLKFGFPYEKIEGITLVDSKKLAIINDSDFGVDDPKVKTVLWLFRLP